SWISRIFIGAAVYGRRWKCWQWLQHLPGHSISPQQSLPKMVPGEIFHYPFARGNAHFRHDSRMLVKMLDGAGDGIDISREDDDAFDSITHHIARFAGEDLWQTTGCRLVSDLGATFQLWWKNVDRRLNQICFHVARETNGADVAAPEFLQVRFRFFVDRTEQPQFGVF